MAVPTELPIGLSDEFAADPSRQTLWTAFVKKNDLAMIPLADVVARIRSALEPAIGLAARTPKPKVAGQTALDRNRSLAAPADTEAKSRSR